MDVADSPGAAIRALASVECLDTDAGYCATLSIDEAVILHDGMVELGYVIVPTEQLAEIRSVAIAGTTGGLYPEDALENIQEILDA